MKIPTVSVAGVPVEIRNKHLPNISSERYPYINLPGRQWILLVQIQCKVVGVERCTPAENILSKFVYCYCAHFTGPHVNLLQNVGPTVAQISTVHSVGQRCIKLNIRPSMALQPFVGPWPLFQFLNPIHSR
jgi:hypothetical protein